MSKHEWKEFALHVINNWFLVRKTMYFILIKDIYFCNKKQKIMIKYQCSNKRIGDTISIDEFMQSPLKHATHPDQMLLIGVQLERQINLIQKFSNTDIEATTHLTRFKQVFYSSDDTKK